jgi:DNA replication protein DnaC
VNSIGEVLSRIGPVPDVETFDAEALLKLPPTDVLERQLTEAQSTTHTSTLVPEERERRIAQAERRLRSGLARDAIHARRSDGCVCLGTGAVPTEIRGMRYGAVRRYYGEDYEHDYVFDAYCPCVDGERVQLEHRRRRAGLSVDSETARRQRLWAGAEVPPLYAGVTLDNFPADSRTAGTVAALRRWLVADKPGLLLWGAFGVGKTSLAISLLRALVLERGQVGMFFVVAELMHELKQAMDTPNESAPRLLSALQRVDVLVLDDLGAEQTKRAPRQALDEPAMVSEWVEEQLYVLLDYRKNHQLRTLVTSNLDPKRLVEHVGKRIMWRALEHADVVHVDGPNLRDRTPGSRALPGVLATNGRRA